MHLHKAFDLDRAVRQEIQLKPHQRGFSVNGLGVAKRRNVQGGGVPGVGGVGCVGRVRLADRAHCASRLPAQHHRPAQDNKRGTDRPRKVMAGRRQRRDGCQRGVADVQCLPIDFKPGDGARRVVDRIQQHQPMLPLPIQTFLRHPRQAIQRGRDLYMVRIVKIQMPQHRLIRLI
ncbi:hypothetical protein D3C86_925800 [compost metagenome]